MVKFIATDFLESKKVFEFFFSATFSQNNTFFKLFPVFWQELFFWEERDGNVDIYYGPTEILAFA